MNIRFIELKSEQKGEIFLAPNQSRKDGSMSMSSRVTAF